MKQLHLFAYDRQETAIVSHHIYRTWDGFLKVPCTLHDGALNHALDFAYFAQNRHCDKWAMLGAVKMEPEHYVYYNLLLAHPVHIRLLGPI